MPIESYTPNETKQQLTIRIATLEDEIQTIINKLDYVRPLSGKERVGMGMYMLDKKTKLNGLRKDMDFLENRNL